jgi:hypothetical protein
MLYGLIIYGFGLFGFLDKLNSSGIVTLCLLVVFGFSSIYNFFLASSYLNKKFAVPLSIYCKLSKF